MLEKYKTVLYEVEQQIVIKKSKFISNLKQVQSEEEALEYIFGIKKKYYDANHHCFAYIIGADSEIERYSDDREPSGTAGKPMLEVLKGFGMKNVVAVVTRYFGGILLGTGGLIRAYTESTKVAIDSAVLYENSLCEKFNVEIDYSYLPKIEHLLHKYNQIIYDTVFSNKVNIIIFIEKSMSKQIEKEIIEINHGQCVIKSEGLYYVAFINDKFIINNLT